MAKHSIGEFIAILRKAGGMTQRDLADKLNVSDKTVSRWERDETAPDISLLPVIADLFGITTDELLRGERIAETVRNEEAEKVQARSEDSVKRLLRRSKNQLMMTIFIALGVALMGVVAAMAINYAANRSGLAFFVGLVLFISALVLQVVTAISTLNANPEDAHFQAVYTFRYEAVRLVYLGISLVLILIASTLPLFANPYSYHTGLMLSSWFPWGLLCAAVMFWICYALYNKVMQAFYRKGILKNLHVHQALPTKIKAGFAMAAALVLLVTAVAYNHQRLNRYVQPVLATFDKVEDFQVFTALEGGTDQGYVNGNSAPIIGMDPPFHYYAISIHGDGIQYDPDQPVGAEQTITIQGADGREEVITFKTHNPDIASLTFEKNQKSGRVVITAYGNAYEKAMFVNYISVLALEILLGVALWHWLKKRQARIL